MNIANIAIKNKNEYAIPKIIHIKYDNLDKVPRSVWENLKNVANGYDIRIYNEENTIDYLLENFGKLFVNIYKRIYRIEHKNDLFRYCVLFNDGGIFLDIKTYPKVSFSKIFDHITNNRLYTTLGNRPHINESILATYKQNIFIKTLIEDFISAPDIIFLVPRPCSSGPNTNTDNYFTDKFYMHLTKHLGYHPSPGVHYIPITNNNNTRDTIVLFEERLEVRENDEKHHDMGAWGIFKGGNNITDCDTRLFITRYSSYPW